MSDIDMDHFEAHVCATANFVEPDPPDIVDSIANLDTLDDDEMRVLQRCVDRLAVMRSRPVIGPGIPGGSALDEGLRLELTDIRLERERADAQHEADRDAVVGQAEEMPGSLTDADMIGAPDLGDVASRYAMQTAAVVDSRSLFGGAVVAQPDRLRRARKMAGLSLGQAMDQLRLGSPHPSRSNWLWLLEAGRETASDRMIRDMSSVYGVAVSWLCGADPVIPAETAALLRDADISTDDRAALTEVIGALATRDTVEMREGDDSWYDGPGWYYTPDPDYGWLGAFASRAIAAQHARLHGQVASDVDGAAP